jgi:deoxyadenosine/deoxycytidine kinase
LNAWNEIIRNSVDVKFLLFVECSFEVMEKRLIKRGETSGFSINTIIFLQVELMITLKQLKNGLIHSLLKPNQLFKFLRRKKK